MSERRRGRRKQLDVSHQRNWLTGRHVVFEVLEAGVWPCTRLCVTPAVSAELADIMHRHDSHGSSSVQQVTAERLTELCGSRHHQGIAAQMAIIPYCSLQGFHRLLEKREESGQLPPLVVICDRIQDGHNLGAILRSCDAMAVDAVIIGENGQIGVTPQVARASAGAVNHVPVVRSDPLLDAVSMLKDAGFQLLAASEKSTTFAWEVDASTATALVIGSEAHGVHDVLLSKCDQQVAIRMLGRMGSLNAAVAAGIMLYELRRRR